VEQPRFRAGFDFLRLRADAGEIDSELADWWEDFGLGDADERDALIAAVRDTSRTRRAPPTSQGRAAAPAGEGGEAAPAKKRRRRRRKPAGASASAEGAAASDAAVPDDGPPSP
jgi:poly(A) polymerase